jgi:hypothetical protein
LFIANIIAFTILVIPDIISRYLIYVLRRLHQKEKMHTTISKNAQKICQKYTKKSSFLNAPKMQKKCIQLTKNAKNSHQKCKKHTKNTKNDISVLTDILPMCRYTRSHGMVSSIGLLGQNCKPYMVVHYTFSIHLFFQPNNGSLRFLIAHALNTSNRLAA